MPRILFLFFKLVIVIIIQLLLLRLSEKFVAYLNKTDFSNSIFLLLVSCYYIVIVILYIVKTGDC